MLKRGTILFFTPGYKEILDLMFLGGMKIYLPCCTQVSDMLALEHALNPKIEQLVFIGTERRTGMEPHVLATLVKNRRNGEHQTKVVLLSASPQIVTPPVDDFVDVSCNYTKILTLANELACRLH